MEGDTKRVWNWITGHDADGNYTVTFVHLPVDKVTREHEYDEGFDTEEQAITQYFADKFTDLEGYAEGLELILVKEQNRKAIAGRLIESRREAGLSVFQAAKLLGMSREEIEELEKGDDSQYYFKEDLMPFARIYGVHVEFLLGTRVPYFSPATMQMINSITNQQDREGMLRLLERFGGDPLPKDK